MDSKAIHEIKSDAFKLLQGRLACAIDAGNWAGVHRMAEELQEIAARGLHYATKERQAEITRFAMGCHAERDIR